MAIAAPLWRWQLRAGRLWATDFLPNRLSQNQSDLAQLRLVAVGGTVGRGACFLEEKGPSQALQTDQMKEVMMTYRISCTSALAIGAAALVSLSTLSAARADSSADPAPTPSFTVPAHPSSAPTSAPTSTATAPSLAEPAPTPAWVEAGPAQHPVGRQPAARREIHHHYAYRDAHRYHSDNPVRTVAMGVAGGAADLGSVAGYPFYCFPNYGSCPVRVPYRY